MNAAAKQTVTRRTAPETTATIDAEIALLKSMRASASCDAELDMIDDAIQAARAARRALVWTRR